MSFLGSGLSSSDDALKVATDRKVKAALNNPIKAAKNQLGADTLALQTNPLSLGMSDAERQKMIGDATQQATEQQQQTIGALNRSALAGQGFQAGEFNQAAQDAAASTAGATAKATVGVNQLNEQMINSEKERILQEMQVARDRQAANQKFWGQFAIDSVAGLLGAVAGSPFGLAQAAGDLAKGPAAVTPGPIDAAGSTPVTPPGTYVS